MKINLYNITAPVFLLLIISLAACSQDSTARPVTQEHLFSFGKSEAILQQTKYANSPPVVLLQLHHDETTGADAALTISQEMGIDNVQLLNQGKRLLDIKTSAGKFSFDPNRMFSEGGIRASLDLHSRINQEVAMQVKNFADLLLTLLDTTKIIVAVHNNRNEGFTLGQYIKNNTGLVHRNANMDADDFFITTDSTIFSRLKEKNFNVVLEYSALLPDDGSLSIYCSKKNRPYVNVEAEHGHTIVQRQMLYALLQILK